MLTLRKRTLEKNGKIRAAGYNLVEIYECELKKDKDFMKFLKTWDRDIVGRLNPRDAFFGGRTNVTNVRKGRYVDFVSLYPTVQYFDRYPTKHQNIILEHCVYDSKWMGFVKCKVLHPKRLYHPVFPVKTKCGNAEKLLFPLCKTCAEVKQQQFNHNDKERSFIGTWCTNELKVALGKGYQVQKICLNSLWGKFVKETT